MTDKRISELDDLAAPAQDDVIPILDASASTAKGIDYGNFFKAVQDANFYIQDSADASKQAQFQLSGLTTATIRTFTLPDASTTFVGVDTTQTLTNKTLTTPIMTTPYVSNGIFDFEGSSGNMRFNANPDGGEYNIGVSATGTLALFGDSTNTLSLKMLDGTIYTDTIGETTAAAGVTVDGLLIKDSKLATNDSVVTANITDDAVTAPKLVGIDKSNLTTDSNPYKFKAYMGSTQALLITTMTKLNMDTESFDTNSNFDTATKFYTVPVSGFYVFFASAQLLAQAGTVYVVTLSLDGTTEWRRLGEIPNTTGNITLNGYIMEQMTAGQTVCAMGYTGTAKTVNSGVLVSYFGGYLVSRT